MNNLKMKDLFNARRVFVAEPQCEVREAVIINHNQKGVYKNYSLLGFTADTTPEEIYNGKAWTYVDPERFNRFAAKAHPEMVCEVCVQVYFTEVVQVVSLDFGGDVLLDLTPDNFSIYSNTRIFAKLKDAVKFSRTYPTDDMELSVFESLVFKYESSKSVVIKGIDGDFDTGTDDLLAMVSMREEHGVERKISDEYGCRAVVTELPNVDELTQPQLTMPKVDPIGKGKLSKPEENPLFNDIDPTSFEKPIDGNYAEKIKNGSAAGGHSPIDPTVFNKE